ncbi:MAG: sigma-54 dependent transcriptional regulator [Verrucomicrobiota bacterium]|nr:sigma-54 dependent transcriptional regulator [Verrucomicrobiota bacterium]
MVIHLLKHPASRDAEAWVTSLGYRCQFFEAEQIKELSHNTHDRVYLIPNESTTGPEWAQMRVRLSQTSRFYVVFGQEMGSLEIVAAMRDGAYDVLNLQDDVSRWKSVLHKASDSQQLWIQIYGGKPLESKDILVGHSVAMQELRQGIERLGPTDATVLILGESGVGKERVAQALHASSGRGSFIAVNCAAIPKDLIEAELFGAEKGAYTGAHKSRKGLVEQANGGTLFLDEVGELDMALQPKLLRFLETRQARRIGGAEDYPVDVRVISATNRKLDEESERQNFRTDLYFRLSEITLRVPPLRLHNDDIPQFVRLFLDMSSERFGKHFDSIEPELVRELQQYRWPGNVRELKSQIDRMVILHDGPVLRASWWHNPVQQNQKRVVESPQQGHFTHHQGQPQPGEISRATEPLGAVRPPAPPAYGAETAAFQPQQYSNPAFAPAWPGASPALSPKQKMMAARNLLEQSNHNLSWVAAQLGIHPTTLYRWRKQGKV